MYDYEVYSEKNWRIEEVDWKSVGLPTYVISEAFFSNLAKIEIRFANVIFFCNILMKNGCRLVLFT